MNKLNPFTKTVRLVARTAVLAAVTASSLSASAATNSLGTAKVTSVTQLGQDGLGSPGLFINVQAGSTTVLLVDSTTVGSPCSANAQTADTIKGMISIAQSALLAGKNVNVFWNVCNGFNYLTRIDLLN